MILFSKILSMTLIKSQIELNTSECVINFYLISHQMESYSISWSLPNKINALLHRIDGAPPKTLQHSTLFVPCVRPPAVSLAAPSAITLFE